MPQKKDRLNQLRTGILARGLKLAKAGIKAGGFAASGWLSNDPANPEALGKIEYLVRELGELKGTAMKVGQSISMYGEHLLPKEINELLKKLQQEAPPLEWPAMLEVLQKELPAEILNELEFETNPVASASIGQVHRARIKATGQEIALKIQYPGVDQAVETDLKLLKFILNLTEIMPRGPRFDQIFDEIRVMFHQEIDYRQERGYAEKFRTLTAGDARFVVARTHERYSTKRVLAMDYVAGVRADHPSVQELPQERRNALGAAFLELYLKELTEWRLVQTDPHLGNYLIQVDPEGKQDRLVLLDFGAAREVPADFLRSYLYLIQGGLHKDARAIEKGGRMLGLLKPEDTLQLVDDYARLCFLITEPFHGVYDWGASDLPKRVAKSAASIFASYRLRSPPREFVFLDRKLGGVFVFLSVLKCVMDTRMLVLRASGPDPSSQGPG